MEVSLCKKRPLRPPAQKRSGVFVQEQKTPVQLADLYLPRRRGRSGRAESQGRAEGLSANPADCAQTSHGHGDSGAVRGSGKLLSSCKEGEDIGSALGHDGDFDNICADLTHPS